MVYDGKEKTSSHYSSAIYLFRTTEITFNPPIAHAPEGTRMSINQQVQIYAKNSLQVNMSAEWNFLDPVILRSPYNIVLTASVLGRISGIEYPARSGI